MPTREPLDVEDVEKIEKIEKIEKVEDGEDDEDSDDENFLSPDDEDSDDKDFLSSDEEAKRYCQAVRKAWVKRSMKRRKRVSARKKLTYENLERVSLRYREEHGLESDQLEDTLVAMCADGWVLSKPLQRAGLRPTDYAQFTAVCNGGTIYTPEFFRAARAPDIVQARGRPRMRAWDRALLAV
jgi:hypothetical protein